MEEKKYLKWYNKIGYGSGDIAGIACQIERRYRQMLQKGVFHAVKIC